VEYFLILIFILCEGFQEVNPFPANVENMVSS